MPNELLRHGPKLSSGDTLLRLFCPIRAIMAKALRNPRAFISCNSDEFKSGGLVDLLRPLIHLCGIETDDLHRSPRPGSNVDAITGLIRECGLFICVVMPKVDSNISPFVLQEIGIASALGKEVLIMLTDEKLKEQLGVGKGRSFVTFEMDLLGDWLRTHKETLEAGEWPQEPYRDVEAIRNYLGKARERFLWGIPIIASFSVRQEGRDKRLPQCLTVDELPEIGSSMNKATFHAGLERIYRQIKDERHVFVPDMFIGVNPTGGFMANWLNGMLYAKGDCRPAWTVHGSPASQVRMFDLDVLPKPQELTSIVNRVRRLPEISIINESNRIVVLVTDCQYKTGRSLSILKDMLEAMYPDLLDIYFAVHVACDCDTGDQPTRPQPIAMSRLIPALRKGEAARVAPDFLAYVTSGWVKPLQAMY